MGNDTSFGGNQGNLFQVEDTLFDKDLYKCVHCGLCLTSCPTYIETGLETESPRGRIAMMKAVAEGRMEMSKRMVSHWDLCLGCRACEAVCPSGVPYGRLIENTRAQVVHDRKTTWPYKLVRFFLLRGLLPYLILLRFMVRILKIYQYVGAQELIRKSHILRILPAGLYGMEAQIPKLPRRFFGPKNDVYYATIRSKMRVGLLSGCVMPLFQAGTMEAAVRVLQRNCCDIVVPEGQGCCGAINLHSGDVVMAQKMARRNIDIFLSSDVEKIVVASAGCGSAMKEYGHLLEGDTLYSEKAMRFSALTVDITEFLADLPVDPPKVFLDTKVTFQDPCHLAHAQGITQAPRTLLRSVPGLKLVELANSDRCCGAAGIYAMLQKAMSGRILDRKMKDVLDTGVSTIVTANPGCAMQLEAGLRQVGRSGYVCHVVDILDQAYQLEDG